MRGSWRPNRNCNILTPLLWPSPLCLSCSPNAQPETQRPTLLGDGFLYCILSASSLDPNSIGAPEPLRPGVAFLTTLSSKTPSVLQLELSWLLSWLSYIIVQRPLSRLLDLWNHMFDRHQAEITVMQFTGHSLPVHQSMRVQWEFLFTLSYFVSQFLPKRFPPITAIRMCHLLPVHHLGMAFLAGSKAKIQQTKVPTWWSNTSYSYLIQMIDNIYLLEMGETLTGITSQVQTENGRKRQLMNVPFSQVFRKWSLTKRRGLVSL